MDLIWLVVSFLLTLMVLSYFLGDNVFFRVATYLFIGVSAGYVAVLLIYDVLWPRLFLPLLSGSLIYLVPLVLAILMLTKLFPAAANLGALPMGLLVGVGAAIAIGGAVLGTLLGQTQAAANEFDLASVSNPWLQFFEALVFLAGMASVLIYFQFNGRNKPETGTPRSPLLEKFAKTGQVFLMITLGAVFAGVLSAALTALIERLDFLTTTVMSLFSR